MKQLELFPSDNDGTSLEKSPEKTEKSSVERRRCVSTVYAPLKRTGAPIAQTRTRSGNRKRASSDSKKRKLWENYWANPCDDTRNDLSLAYLALVKMIAEGLKDKFPTHVDVNDLVSTGYIGLLDAISKFNPDLNIKFESYGVLRIRGEILDSIRNQNIVPRQVRILQNNYRRALKDLARTLHREPSEEEIAAHMKLTPKQFETLIHSFSSGRIVSIDAAAAKTKAATAPPTSTKCPRPTKRAPRTTCRKPKSSN